MKKLTLFSLFALAVALDASAQSFLQQPDLQNRPAAKKVTFWDVRKAFDTYWAGRTVSSEESENREGGGWNQYKRWEWFAGQRTFPSGNFPDPNILFNEYKTYSNQYASRMAASAANWSFIGPQVIPGNGGGAGRVNCMAFDPFNANVIWIGAACGGLWKSTDGGVTWTSNTDLLPVLSISDIVIDPVNPQNMYIATGDKYGIYWQYEVWGHYSAGILKSTDGGLTWNQSGLSYAATGVTLIQRLVMDPNNPNTLFAATYQGIFETNDGGLTWTNDLAGQFYDVEFRPGSSTTIYAGDSIGFQRSLDGGTTWSYVSLVTSNGRTSIAVTADNTSAVYAWSEGGDFYYSSNSGASFVTRTDPVGISGPYGHYDMVLEVSPLDENTIFTGGLDIAKSTDGGMTWTAVSDWAGWPNPDYVHADNHAQQFAPGSNTTIYSCNDGGIFRSTDGGATWTDLSAGIDIKQYYRMGSSFLTPNLIYAGAQDNGTDKITGLATASMVNGADGEECLVDYTDDNIVFVSSQGGYFLKSTDGGATFSGLSEYGCDWTSPLIMDPTNHDVMYMGSSDVHKSLDNGNTWTNVTNGFFDGSCVYSLEVCPTSTNYIYAATFGNIYRSTNGGASWSTITGTLPVNSAAISGITVSDSDPDAVWVTFSGFSPGNKVYYSTDGGATWSNVSGTLPNLPANCIEYQNSSNDILYLGTDIGVFYMDATMNDWQPYNTGLPNVIIDELEIHYPTSKLRAATFGRGLWESDLMVSTLQNIDASALSMTYPPATTCDTLIAPVVRIRNAGVDTLSTVDLYYSMDSQPWQVYNWSGALASMGTANISLPAYTLGAGIHTLEAYTTNPNASTDQNMNNDTIVRSFTVLSGIPANATAPPVTEGFVASAFPPANWTLENSTAIWDRSTTVGGYGNSTQSAYANFYGVYSGEDKIETQYIDFSNAIAPIRLYFDVAYAPYGTTYPDSLIVDMFNACPGAGQRIYARGQSTLATAPQTFNVFVPTPSQWRTDTINLDSLAGRPGRTIRFIGKSGYGNQLYLDNINLTANGVGIWETNNAAALSVYPNPANTQLNVEITTTGNDKIQLAVYDLAGQVVQSTTQPSAPGKNTTQLDISTLAEGVYILRVEENGNVMTKRIAIIR